MVSHRAAWLRAIEHDVESGATGRRGYVVMFGLFHMAGWSSIETSWSSDRPIHLVTRAEPHELLGIVERHGASTLYCIPAVWQRILDEDTGHDTSGVVEALTGTSLVTLELIDGIKARFPGSWTSIAYGSTEIGRGATLLDPDLYDHPGSVGQPPPMVTAELSDDGELWLRGPTMFSGYLDRPDATAEAIDDDGWFHTGDLATRDVDGYFTITGRRSESIRSGGEWVAPIEVETAVRSHPAVEEVAVVGLPDDRWGELVCAAIVVRPGAHAPDRRRAARPRRLGADRRQAAPRRRAGRRAPAHRRHRPDPSAPSCATRSSPSGAHEGGDGRFGRDPHASGRMRFSPVCGRVGTARHADCQHRASRARRSTRPGRPGPKPALAHGAGRGRGTARHGRDGHRDLDRPRPQRGPPPRATRCTRPPRSRHRASAACRASWRRRASRPRSTTVARSSAQLMEPLDRHRGALRLGVGVAAR